MYVIPFYSVFRYTTDVLNLVTEFRFSIFDEFYDILYYGILNYSYCIIIIYLILT